MALSLIGSVVLLAFFVGTALSAVTPQQNAVTGNATDNPTSQTTTTTAPVTSVSPQDNTSNATDNPTSQLVTTTTQQTPVTVAPPDMSSMCDQLATTFNSINSILPMYIVFEAGESMGIPYPSGKLLLDSNARKLDACVSYQVRTSSAVIVHLEITETLEMQFPQFEIDGKNWTLSFIMEGCHIVLHYSILPIVSPNGRHLLNMSVILGELKSLDVVTIRSDNPELDGRSFTREAEDLIRPYLFTAFNSFAKEELQWEVDPSSRDTNLDGFDTFKLIFKRQMIEISGAYSGPRI